MGNKGSSTKSNKPSDSQTQDQLESRRDPSRQKELPNHQNAATNASMQNSLPAPLNAHFVPGNNQVMMNVYHPSGDYTYHGSGHGVRDGSLDVISEGSVSHRVKSGLDQGRNTGTKQKMSCSGFPCGGPAGFGGFVVIEKEVKTDSRYENQTSSKIHKSYTLDGTVDHQAKTSIVDLSSRSCTPYRESSSTATTAAVYPDATRKSRPSLDGILLSASRDGMHCRSNAGSSTMQNKKSGLTGTAFPSDTNAHQGLNAGSSTMQNKQSSLTGTAFPSNTNAHQGLNAGSSTMQNKQSGLTGTALPSNNRAHYGLNAGSNIMQNKQPGLTGTALPSNNRAHYGLNAGSSTMQNKQSSLTGTTFPSDTNAHHGLNAGSSTMQNKQSGLTGTALPSNTNAHQGLNAGSNIMQNKQSGLTGTALPSNNRAHYGLNAGSNIMQNKQPGLTGTALPSNNRAHYGLNAGSNIMQNKQPGLTGTVLPSNNRAHYGLNAGSNIMQNKQPGLTGTVLPSNNRAHYGLNAGSNIMQNKQPGLTGTALPSNNRAHYSLYSKTVDQGRTNIAKPKTPTISSKESVTYSLQTDRERAQTSQSDIGTTSYGVKPNTVNQSMNASSVQSTHSTEVMTYRPLAQPKSYVVSDNQLINTDLSVQNNMLSASGSTHEFNVVSEQVDDVTTDDNWADNLPFSMARNETFIKQEDDYNAHNLPFSLKDDCAPVLEVEDYVMNKSVPFSFKNAQSVDQVNASAVEDPSNDRPTSSLDDDSDNQVKHSVPNNCPNDLPFCLRDGVTKSCEPSPQTNNISNEVATQGTQDKTSYARTRSWQQKIRTPLCGNECLVCITLPGAVDLQVAIHDLKHRLQNFEFELQGLQNNSRKLHSRNYVICFTNKDDVSLAMDVLKNGKIKAVHCEDILEKSMNNILEEKDLAMTSHQQKCDEVMQSIANLQSDKKGVGAGKTKFIAFDKFEKREAERAALMQKALELNCQKKEFTAVVGQLIDRILSLKAVKIGWKELDSEIKEVKQLMEREKDRLKKALPIYAKRSLITDTVKTNQVSIILGETGSGKSTQVVQYLYDSGLAENGVIVCTQPRKVAAFSLEKFVCEEMKGSGHAVECSVGTRAADKRAKKAKILFTTDYSLLMECIKEQDLTRFSCIIIDEAHERNINTDLLLGIIKKALPRRPDLRVIITSATINPALFIKYFGDCPVVKVSGKTFPVDVIWNQQQGRSGDYVLEAVEKVVEIHENEEPGDVLVFLTCPAEIEQACTKVQNRIKRNDIQFLPLHGKLRQEEQREVFNPTPKGKRKVVFSTNCAETSLTIPGIKFVVDTGKVKEMKYDPKRNINSLEVSDVSQSSADQRKGRAGRIESGKCYRLYNEDDFKAMEKSTKPEILRVNLGQALLKLMELGIRNPADFDYVESPPVESIKTAMIELKDLGATSDGELTELGKKMAKVPVEPGLAKFLFEGIEQGVGYEALVLVSVATINGNVFFRMGTEEEKKAADMKKVEFCHLGGDFMTLLDVYRSWQRVDKRDRGRWCFDKSLNAKAMRMADETVKDLLSTMKHELQMNDIKWSSLDKEATDGRLQKTLFSCFMTKLCVYTGHERKGYKTISGGHFVKIHPSSSINFTGSNPQFIVYEKILKTSQDYLLNVTPIEASWLKESIAEKKLGLDVEEVLAEVWMVAPPISIRCSSILIKRAFEPFRSKLPNLEKSISDSCNNAPIVVEAKRNTGKVDLFVPKKYSDKAMELIQRILEEQKTRLREETREYPVIAESSAFRVVMGKGLAVQQLLLPDMYRSVVVRNLQERPLYSANVKEFLCQFGKLVDLNSLGNMHFATYERPEDASQAVMFCTADELGYRVEPKKVQHVSLQGRDSSRFNFRIKISWHRREPKGMANVSFENQTDEMWIRASSITALKVRSQLARVRVDKHKEDNLFLNNLSPNTTKQDIREAVENVLDGCITITDRDILIQYKQRATPVNTQAQKTVLEELISNYATPGSFEVTVKEFDVSYKSPFAIADVDFFNPNEGIQVVRHLSGKSCRILEAWKVHLEVKPFLNFFDTCLASVYELVRDEIQSKINEIAKECAESCKRQIRLKEKPAKSKGRIELSVDTTCLEHHLQASKEISKCIQGEKIECTKPSECLLGKSGRDHLQQIQRESGAFICTDERTMALTIYGTSKQREKARDAIYSFFQELALQGSTVWEVNLKEDGMPRGLMKQLMTKHGREFEGLLQIEGVNKVDVHFSRQVLKIQSTPEARGHLLNEIEGIAKTIAPLQPRNGTETEEEECPTCFCVIDNETPSYRLAVCGHACCMTCIEQQFNAAVFPLCCTYEDCPEMFSLDMISLLTTKKNAQLHEKVMKMSLKSYVEANQDKARYCPTPDCPMVYPVTMTTNGKLFRCSVCSTATCSSCHQPYHLGLTCEENEIEKKDPGSQTLLERWMKEKPGRRKRCPKCNAPIEKNGGCNHMQCTLCKAHICWPCMRVFVQGTEVYAHQQSCPRRLAEASGLDHLQ